MAGVRQLPAVTAVFETADPGLAHRFLGGSYERLELAPNGRGHDVLRVARHDSGPVRLDRISSPARVEVRGAPLDSFGFGRVAGGQVVCRRDRNQIVHRAGDVFLASQPGQPIEASLEAADLELAFIDEAVADEVVEGDPARGRGAVRFTGCRPVSSESAQWWGHAYDYVSQALTDSAVAEPLLARPLARFLVAASLAAFPHRYTEDVAASSAPENHRSAGG
jgi:hypothetical protein